MCSDFANEMVGETLRYTLNTLASVAPEWTYANTKPERVQRYGKRVSDYWLPKSKVKRTALAEQIGMDGLHLLNAIWTSQALLWLRHLSS